MKQERGLTSAMCLEHRAWTVVIGVGSPIGDEVGDLCWCHVLTCLECHARNRLNSVSNREPIKFILARK